MAIIYSSQQDGFSLSHSLDKHPSQKDFSMHIHNHNEIFVFVSGNASYLVEGTEYPLKTGDFLLIREGESHAVNFLADEPYERFVLNFPPSAIEMIDPERRLLSPFYERNLGVGNLYQAHELPGISALSYFEAMCEKSDDPYAQKITIYSHFLPFLYDIGQAFKKKEKPTELRGVLPSQIISYVNRHLFEQLTTADIANKFYLSVSQLERIFKQATHSSVWHYIQAKRLSAARAKIECGVCVLNACIESGFSDYSSFYRAYVKTYGEPPSVHKQSKK